MNTNTSKKMKIEAETEEENIEWSWYPSPPEMLVARLDGIPNYMYECVGTVDASADDKGDLLRVWVPDKTTPFNKDIISDLTGKHGVYADSIGDARELDSFTESAWKHSFESVKNANFRLDVDVDVDVGGDKDVEI